MTYDPYIVAGHIRASLHRIRDHYDDAGDPPKHSDDSDPRKGDPARPPTDLHAIDVRRDTHHDLAFWTQFILDTVNATTDPDTGMTVGTITTKVDGSNVHALAAFVDTWALALAEQADPDDALNCRRDMRGHGDRLRDIAQGVRTKRVTVGPCPELLMTVDESSGLEQISRCPGTIVSTLRERHPDDDEDGLLPQAITCTHDRDHKWSPWQWVDVGRRIGRQIGA